MLGRGATLLKLALEIKEQNENECDSNKNIKFFGTPDNKLDMDLLQENGCDNQEDGYILDISSNNNNIVSSDLLQVDSNIFLSNISDYNEKNEELNIDNISSDAEIIKTAKFFENLINQDQEKVQCELGNYTSKSSNSEFMEEEGKDEAVNTTANDNLEETEVESTNDKEENREENTHPNVQDNELKIKKRKHYAEPDLWKKNRTKKSRMLGQPYIGYTRTKEGVINHDTPRDKRILGPACTSEFCRKAANRHCDSFTQEERQQIFDKFWSITWEQKKLFLLHMVSYKEKSRSYTKTPSRRQGTYNYFLKKENGKYQVCKKTFLSTLGLKERTVQYWVNEGNKFGMPNNQEHTNKKKLAKKRNSRHMEEINRQKEHLVSFLTNLPKMESHYCRKNTAKLYLEEDFKSKADVFNVYKTKCLEENLKPLTIYPFLRQFDEMNLSLFKPRKDQCDLCCSYKMGQVDETVYQEHITSKNLAREAKEADKVKAEKNLIYAYTMDVQAVKLCPKVQASSLYYKTKLQVHNFTVYNLETHESKNYIWNETEGELCASVFVTCIIKHLEAALKVEKKPIVLYSDSCGYQNKNVFLSNALSLLSSKYDVIIEQKYLEKGHTQMECDSSHSLIERRLKGKDIYLPTDYIGIVREARKTPKPMTVEYMDYSYFLDYTDPNCMRYATIRPGKNKKELKVSDIKCLKYEPDGTIMFKAKYCDEYLPLPQRQKVIDVKYNPKPLYSERLKISITKWKHLQELKKVLPKDVHSYYDSIPYDDKKQIQSDTATTSHTINEEYQPEEDQNTDKIKENKSKKSKVGIKTDATKKTERKNMSKKGANLKRQQKKINNLKKISNDR